MKAVTGKTDADYRKRLLQLEAFASERGAYRAKVFPSKDVVVDERVRMKCQIPVRRVGLGRNY